MTALEKQALHGKSKQVFGRLRASLEVVALASFTIVCLAMLWRMVGIPPPGAAPPPDSRSARAASALPTVPIALDTATLKGSRTAKLAVLMFSEFQCPFCARFAQQTFPDIERDYVQTGLVLFAFRHLPLESIHSFALKAAESAECAGRQSKFWEMHDLLFQNPKQLQAANLLQYARAAGVDERAFSSCLDGGATDRVRLDVAQAAALGVDGTPTFLIGTLESGLHLKATRRVSGAETFAKFKQYFDEALRIASQ